MIVWTPALDQALDEAETEWITTVDFRQDERFAAVVDGRLVKRHRSGLQHAAARNLCGLGQSRRTVRIKVPCREGHYRWRTAYAYALWRIYRWLGIEDPRRPQSPSPPRRGPLPQSVQFAAATVQEEEAPPAPLPIPRPRPAPSVMFVSPPSLPELDACGADPC